MGRKDKPLVLKFKSHSRIDLYNRIKDLFLNRGWTFVQEVRHYTKTDQHLRTKKDNKYRGRTEKEVYYCIMKSPERGNADEELRFVQNNKGGEGHVSVSRVSN